MTESYERRVKWTEVFATVDGDRWEATPTDRKERLIAAYQPEVDAAMKLADLEKHREREARNAWEARCLDAEEKRDAWKAQFLEAQKGLEEAKESRDVWKAKYLDDPFSPRNSQECSFKETGVHVSAVCCPSKSVEDNEEVEIRDAVIEEMKRQIKELEKRNEELQQVSAQLRRQSSLRYMAIQNAAQWLAGDLGDE